MRVFVAQSIILLFLNIKLSIEHGYLIEPAARSSAWRVDTRFPKYFNDMVN
jgi:hypothetical protein